MLNKNFVQKIKESLVDQRRLLIAKINETNDVDADGDETDEIQANMLIEMDNQLNSRNNEKINQIDNALQRINTNSYGTCVECGDDISEKRLLINPHSALCISCAEEKEIELKRARSY